MSSLFVLFTFGTLALCFLGVAYTFALWSWRAMWSRQYGWAVAFGWTAIAFVLGALVIVEMSFPPMLAGLLS